MERLPTDEALDLRAGLAAGRAADKLRSALGTSLDPSALLKLSLGGVAVSIPAAAVQALIDVLEDLSEGRQVTVAPAELPVGTLEAARILGVSRPWVAELIDRGELVGARAGSKRRVPLGGLVEHRRRLAEAQRDAAAQLADVGGSGAPGGQQHPSEAAADRSPLVGGRIRHSRLAEVAEEPPLPVAPRPTDAESILAA